MATSEPSLLTAVLQAAPPSVRRKLRHLLSEEPAEAAATAHLRYVNDDEAGIRRQPWGRGFTYFDAKGKRIQDKTVRARFQELAIPPAWSDVWICADTAGHIQATGRDDEGRKQYIYHARWEAVRNRVKFERLALFGLVLPALRRQLDRDLAQRHFPRTRVIALVIRLLDATYIRIGNPEYAQNGAYGLTTLLNDHLTVSGARLHFSFVGKQGRQQEIDLRDRELARLTRRCQELPGQHLFVYEDEKGEWRPLTSGDVNDYLHRHMGRRFSAKDFRTWGATVTVTQHLLTAASPAQETDADAAVKAAIAAAATQLGHTPAVCRTYYVHPAILDRYRRGTLAEAATEWPGLSAAEATTLAVLLDELDVQLAQLEPWP
ncbi:MAG: DNA topoisomerase IB [Caldilineaceae bacterium]|nr:DNA topoisomerase IB [Caldilineaceae bacterium]